MISTWVVPPGGWKFLESGFEFEAQTFSDLEKVVAEYRAANGIPKGDPGQEIMQQIEGNNPSFSINQPKPMPLDITAQIKSFAATLSRWIMSGGKLVDQNTANIRTSTCAGCHNNVSDELSKACVPCGAIKEKSVEFIRAGVLHGRRAVGDVALKTCALCGCDLKMKIWFPVETFDPDGKEKNKWPTFCWMKE